MMNYSHEIVLPFRNCLHLPCPIIRDMVFSHFPRRIVHVGLVGVLLGRCWLLVRLSWSGVAPNGLSCTQSNTVRLATLWASLVSPTMHDKTLFTFSYLLIP